MEIKIRHLGCQSYSDTFQAMVAFTQNRTTSTLNELWLVEHPAVFTQGRHGKPEHIINPHNIPVVQSDRGGQVTYHGPGQAVIYLLFDLKVLRMGIKDFVCHIEKACIEMLKKYSINAQTREKAPGIYIDDAKIASLGLRVKNGLTYHGIAINTDMDLTPFSYINPCGYDELKMTQIRHYNLNITTQDVLNSYAHLLADRIESTCLS